MKQPLQKIISMNTAMSRRKAEEMIKAGKVKLNGRRAEPGARADSSDMITVNGREIPRATKLKYIVLNKPVGYVCTNRKFEGEKNVFELIDGVNLFVAGRLDKDSQGLILLTNDGDLANRLTHPRHRHEKVYLVKARPAGRAATLKEAGDLAKRLMQGFKTGDLGFVKAKAAKAMSANDFEVVLTTGKKRQIRRMFEDLGWQVRTLERTAIGPLRLKGLKQGEARELSPDEVADLKKEAYNN